MSTYHNGSFCGGSYTNQSLFYAGEDAKVEKVEIKIVISEKMLW